MSRQTIDQWPHLFAPGSGPVLLMLHGTGGSERQIAPLASLLDPSAAVLAPRGRVLESGMRRWFRRYAEGVFNTGSVIEEAAALAGFIEEAKIAYDLVDRQMIAVGVSNGANIALATALLHPATLHHVVSFSGMHPLAGRPIEGDAARLEVLLLNGDDDPMAPTTSVDRLERDLRASGASVERIPREGGHGIYPGEIDDARRWLASRVRDMQT